MGREIGDARRLSIDALTNEEVAHSKPMNFEPIPTGGDVFAMAELTAAGYSMEEAREISKAYPVKRDGTADTQLKGAPASWVKA